MTFLYCDSVSRGKVIVLSYYKKNTSFLKKEQFAPCVNMQYMVAIIYTC